MTKLWLANDVDEALWLRKDTRAWAQRVFWLVGERDIVILSDIPDKVFIDHVSQVRCCDLSKVEVHVPNPGRATAQRIDPLTLVEEEFLAKIRPRVHEIKEISGLFPSPALAYLAEALGLRSRLPGYKFLAEGGGAIANSKATFRLLAGRAGVSIAPGYVCADRVEAVLATEALFNRSLDVVVKKAHAGAGAGNEMLLRSEVAPRSDIGVRYARKIEPTRLAIKDYWDERWDWATGDSRFPVCVEELLDVAYSCYAEFLVSSDGVQFGTLGELSFIERNLAVDTIPPLSMSPHQQEKLASTAESLAATYRDFGYRGYLCADAVVCRDGRIVFTEVNARTTTSTHLYSLKNARHLGSLVPSERIVQQHLSPKSWGELSTQTFLERVSRAGLIFDLHSQTGVMMTMPPPRGTGFGFMFIVVQRTLKEAETTLEALGAVLKSDDHPT